MILAPITKIFRALGSDGTPRQLALGFITGMFMGLVPFGSGLWFVGLAVLLIFNMSLTMGLAAAALFGLINAIVVYYGSYPLGYVIIETFGNDGPGKVGNAWGAFVKSIGENSALSWTRLHEWAVMGGVVLWALLALPAYVGVKKFTTTMRKRLEKLGASGWITNANKSFAKRWALWLFLPSLYAIVKAAAKSKVNALKAAQAAEQAAQRALSDARNSGDADAIEDAEFKLRELKELVKTMSGQPAVKSAISDELKAAAAKEAAAAPASEPPTKPESKPEEKPKAAAKEKPAEVEAGEVTAAASDELGGDSTLLDGLIGWVEGGKKTKRRMVRRMVAVPLALVILVPAVALIAAFIYRNAIVKSIIEGPVAAQLGMEIRVGDVELQLDKGAVVLKNFTVMPARTPDGAAKDGIDPATPLFTASQLKGEIDPEQLGNFRLHMKLEAVEPVLTLVRLKDGSMNYQTIAVEDGTIGEKGAPLAARAILDENGQPVIATIEIQKGEATVSITGELFENPTTGERWLKYDDNGTTTWRSVESGEEIKSEDPPTFEDSEPDSFDAQKSPTFDEVKKFIEEMVKKYGLDDPNKLQENFAKYREALLKHGPKAAGDEAVKDAVAAGEDLEKIIRDRLLSIASYVTNPPGAPAVGKPTFWLKSLTINNASVRYIDLRDEHPDTTIKQEQYTFDVRNISTDRFLLDEPFVVVVGRGIAVDQAANLADVAIAEPPMFGSVREAMANYIADQQLPEAQRTGVPNPKSLVNCVLFQINTGIEIEELVTMFTPPGQEPIISGGKVSIYTADISYADGTKFDWANDRSLWWFDPATGTGKSDGGRLQNGSLGFFANRMRGVFVVQLESVRLNKGALGVPDFVYEFLADWLQSDWRFVLAISDTVGKPGVVLLNEPEVMAQFRTIAVRAVHGLIEGALGSVLDELIARERARFVAAYGATPETFVVWEQGSVAIDPARLYARAGEGVRLRSVITPLLFVGDKNTFLNFLAYNAVQVCRVLVMDVFDEVVGSAIEQILKAEAVLANILGIPPATGGSAEQRARVRAKLLHLVAPKLVPEFVLDEKCRVQFKEGGNAFKARSDAALAQFKENLIGVTQEVLQHYVDALVQKMVGIVSDAINKIPQELLPENYTREQLREKLLAGVEDLLKPEVTVGDNFQIKIDFDGEGKTNALRDQLSKNAVAVLQDLTKGYTAQLINATVDAFARVVNPLPNEAAIRTRLADGVAEATFLISVGPNGLPSIRVELEAGRDKLFDNAKLVLADIAEQGISDLVDEAVNAFKQVVNPLANEAQIRATLKDGIARSMFQITRAANGSVDIKVNMEAARDQLFINAGKAADMIAEPLVNALVDPMAQKLSELVGPLPGTTVSLADIVAAIKVGVAQAYLPDDCVRRDTNGGLRVMPNATAARNVALANFRNLAAKIGADVAEGLVAEGTTAIVNLFPDTPGYANADAVANAMKSGVGTAVVKGNTPESLRFDLAAGRTKVSQNAVVVARRMADATVTAAVAKVVAELDQKIEKKPANWNPQALTNRLKDGVGNAMIVGTALENLRLDLPKAGDKLTQNTLAVARDMSGFWLSELAREIIQEPARALGATQPEIETAIAETVAGVPEILFPTSNVAVDANGQGRIEPNADAAKAALQRNADAALSRLSVILLRRNATNLFRAAMELQMLPDEKPTFDAAYWNARGMQIVTEQLGQQYMRADARGKQAIIESLPSRTGTARRTVTTDLVLMRASGMLAKQSIRINPLIGMNDVTPADIDKAYNGNNLFAISEAAKDVLVRADRVIDAVIAQKLNIDINRVPGFMRDQTRNQARNWIRNNIR